MTTRRLPKPQFCAVAVFTKPPRPGRVKTRLIGPLTARQAASLHLACLKDTLQMVEKVRGADCWLYVSGTPAEVHRLAAQLGLGPRWHRTVQRGADLGERMSRGIGELLARGYQRVAIVGTDTPWMRAQRVTQALAALRRSRVVLGPSEDGGYYVVAARGRAPEMFRGIRWGTGEVLGKTRAALKRCGVSWHELALDFDLDRMEDLLRLEKELNRGGLHSPHIASWLRGWRVSESSRRRARGRRDRKRRPARA
jgi:hypothetical protein